MEGASAPSFFFVILNSGKIIVTPSHCYIGPSRMDLTQDTKYTHPTSKQCNYSVPVVNNLTSTSTTSALSAAQGKILNDKLVSSGMDVSWTKLASINSTYNEPGEQEDSDIGHAYVKNLFSGNQYADQIFTHLYIYLTATTTVSRIYRGRNNSAVRFELYLSSVEDVATSAAWVIRQTHQYCDTSTSLGTGWITGPFTKTVSSSVLLHNDTLSSEYTLGGHVNSTSCRIENLSMSYKIDVYGSGRILKPQ